MAKIAEILQQKGSEVYTIGREETVYRAIEVMSDRNWARYFLTAEVVGASGEPRLTSRMPSFSWAPCMYVLFSATMNSYL